MSKSTQQWVHQDISCFLDLIWEKVKAKTSYKIQSLVKFQAKRKENVINKYAVIISEQDAR